MSVGQFEDFESAFEHKSRPTGHLLLDFIYGIFMRSNTLRKPLYCF